MQMCQKRHLGQWICARFLFFPYFTFYKLQLNKLRCSDFAFLPNNTLPPGITLLATLPSNDIHQTAEMRYPARSKAHHWDEHWFSRTVHLLKCFSTAPHLVCRLNLQGQTHLWRSKTEKSVVLSITYMMYSQIVFYRHFCIFCSII